MTNQIKENVAAADAARAEVRGHCMALRVTETKEHLHVLFPLGYRIDGVRVTKKRGIIWACQQAIRIMEREWCA